MSTTTDEFRKVIKRLSELGGETLTAVTSGQFDLAETLQRETRGLAQRQERLYAQIREEHRA